MKEAAKAVAPQRDNREKRRASSPLLSGEYTSWVLIPVVARATGYSENAIRVKLKRGIWPKGVFWHHGPDNRVMLHLPTVERWMGGQHG